MGRRQRYPPQSCAEYWYAVLREVFVEREGSVDAKFAHDDEAGGVGVRKAFVAVLPQDRLGPRLILRRDANDRHGRAVDRIKKADGGSVGRTVANQGVGLIDEKGGHDQPWAMAHDAALDRDGVAVMLVAAIGEREPGAGVNQHAAGLIGARSHGRWCWASSASARYASTR